ncbi:hypothetical protein PR048_001512 [Dryococelus australis]|uniref:CCHC-type domain-containing protein n=1 Tax=Dryococelus australis TaxID=614101 RepID=A0ABQ9IIZ4_9NEOP|nr:hypothetical protein PR048_001512 [Dryococelus australis]
MAVLLSDDKLIALVLENTAPSAQLMCTFMMIKPKTVQELEAWGVKDNNALYHSEQQVKHDSDVDFGDLKNARKTKEITCCNYCGNVGHYASHCKLPQKEKWKCFNCGRVRHIVKDCSKGSTGTDDEV